MTEKELHRLRRQDLLQLLLAQSREVNRQQEELESLNLRVSELQTENIRLQEMLNRRGEGGSDLRDSLDRLEASMASVIARLDRGVIAAPAAGEAETDPGVKQESRADAHPPRPETDEERAERLAYLRDLLARNKEQADRLRKEEA